MAIARADLEAEAAIKRGLRVQIMRGDDEVVDGAGQWEILRGLERKPDSA